MSADSSQQSQSAPAGSPRLGGLLRAERERRGTKLVKVAAETRVGVHYLAALEHSDYEELPGEVFTKNYVRSYAEYLGLDADKMVQLYLDETADRRPAPGEEGDEQIVREMSRVLNVKPESSRSPLWVAGGVIVGLLAIAMGWWWLADSQLSAESAQVRRPVHTPPPAMATDDDIPAEAVPASAPEEPVREPVVQGSTEPEPSAAPKRQESPALPVELAERDGATEQAIDTTPDDTPQADVETVARQVTPEPQAEPPAEIVHTDSSVAVISEFGVGSEVRDRTLIGETDRFLEGSEVWFWNRILQAEPGTILQHVWLHEGAEVSRVSLAIGASHWRTQSRKTLHPGSAGQWAVEVRDPQGNTLARAEFLCEDPA